MSLPLYPGEDQRQPISADWHRPEYHYLPRANWINDPNGLIQWKGLYHLFYQYNPHGPFPGTIHWGHAVSPDLVRWTELPIALTPDPAGPDRDGCWSGCAVDDHGRPAILYTGAHPQTQCLAWGDDDLLTWRKYPGNPVLSAPPAGLGVVGGARWDWRDPWVWREGAEWRMLVGTGLHGIGGAVLLYRSDDLIHWEYLNPLLTGASLGLGEVWECPSLMALGDRHVLLVSPGPESRHTYFVVGAYDGRQFTPEAVGQTDQGPYFYAAQPLLDEAGRRLLFGWIKEGRTRQAQEAAGWAGVMSLPRVLTLGPSRAPAFETAPELTTLRGQHYQWVDLVLDPNQPPLLEAAHGPCLEIVAEFEAAEAEMFGFWVCASPDGRERTLIAFESADQCLLVDRLRASLSPGVDHTPHSAPVPPAAGGWPPRLHIFVDHSVIEVFAGTQTCLTTRVYPTRPESVHVLPVTFGGPVRLRSLDVWILTPGAHGARAAT